MGKEWLSFEIIALPTDSGALPRLEGENAREILLLFKKDEDPAIKEFLLRMMRAAGVELNKDTYFAGIEQGFEPSFAQLWHLVPFQKLLIFGIKPQAIGLHLEYTLYQPIVFRDKTILISDCLRDLSEERARNGKERSGALWAAMKEIFKV